MMEILPEHGWKRVLVICGLFLIYVFGIVIPWAYGWRYILEMVGILK